MQKNVKMSKIQVSPLLNYWFLFRFCAFLGLIIDSQQPNNTSEPINPMVDITHISRICRNSVSITLSQHPPMWAAHPATLHRFTGQRLLGRMVTTVSLEGGEKICQEKKEKRWVMNYRVDHFRLSPGRVGETTRERDSPLILPCPVCYVGSHWGERFMANWSGSNIPWKATSGSIATILAGHINPVLYVVLSVQ